MRESDFACLTGQADGEVYIVGGWVRDRLRGVPAHDRDYVVTGLTEDVFCGLFPEAFKVGNSFPVYRMPVDGDMSEVALARSERKTGTGYKGFAVSFSPDTTIEDDLFRRDTTMNSIAFSLQTKKLIDPYGGAQDIRDRMIRATSEHFTDDPVRALRAARQAAQFGFRIEPMTIEMMRACRGEIALEPKERLVKELTLALESEKPSVFFRNLLAAGILDVSYPQLFALVGVSQPPEHHPEGDAFAHTMDAVDRAALLTDRTEVRFAVLAHDLGKALTPDEMLPHHYDHDTLGLDALKAFNRTMTLPRLWVSCAAFAIKEHMRACRYGKIGKIVDFIDRLSKHPIGFDGFAAVVRADNKELPSYLQNYKVYLDAIRSVDGNDAPPELTGERVGRWVREQQIRAVMKALATQH